MSKVLWAALIACVAMIAVVVFRPHTNPARPDIVVVLIDTLRPDHLGVYGYARPTSPNIDRIAASSTVFEGAYSVSPWTNPSVATLFTGHYPRSLFPPVAKPRAYQQSLPGSVPTLAGRLGKSGYRTIAIIDHPAIGPGLGFNRDFHTTVELFQGRMVYETEPVTPEGVVKALRDTRSTDGRPEFTYIHLVQPHWPYEPPPAYRDLFGPVSSEHDPGKKAENINGYDAEIRYADDVVAAIELYLREQGSWDSTWFVLMSDHGEGFWEHGLHDHGNSFFDELLRVPLIIRAPPAAARPPARVATRLSTVNLMATLLDMAGVDAPLDLPGRSLLRDPRDWAQPIFSEDAALLDGRQASVIRGRFKYMGEPQDELFDIEADPAERSPLPANHEQRAILKRALEDQEKRTKAARAGMSKARGGLDPETAERLRALGYRP